MPQLVKLVDPVFHVDDDATYGQLVGLRDYSPAQIHLGIAFWQSCPRAASEVRRIATPGILDLAEAHHVLRVRILLAVPVEGNHPFFTAGHEGHLSLRYGPHFLLGRCNLQLSGQERLRATHFDVYDIAK